MLYRLWQKAAEIVKKVNLWAFLRGFKNKYFLKKFEPYLLPFFAIFFLKNADSDWKIEKTYWKFENFMVWENILLIKIVDFSFSFTSETVEISFLNSEHILYCNDVDLIWKVFWNFFWIFWKFNYVLAYL